ncbi:hypothetical protein [Streptomyces bicolor]|uniref:hypothetical protein n=1 Tax=Streptomyces bicolor TaxID=66874 RepID=UPI00131B5C2D|nr:hypothetical protein [Streptomyces bicolor]
MAATPWWKSGFAMRWTFPVTGLLGDVAYERVADTFAAWGVSARLADLLGELVADYTEAVCKAALSRYMAVTAMLEGRRATVSVTAAHTFEPAQSAHVPYRGETFLESSWGRADLATGPCRYAAVKLINVQPL